MATHYAVNGAHDVPSSNNGPWCRHARGTRVSNNEPAGLIVTTYFASNPTSSSYDDSGLHTSYRPLKITALKWPSQLIAVGELIGQRNNSGGSTLVPIRNSNDYGIWAGHLGRSNYLFMDGHVKALRPTQIAVPINMMDVNKQDQPCQQAVDGRTGQPGLLAVEERYGS